MVIKSMTMMIGKSTRVQKVNADKGIVPGSGRSLSFHLNCQRHYLIVSPPVKGQWGVRHHL
jgi:hypothetical protein